jgi:lipoyl(octanoyl) transferase
MSRLSTSAPEATDRALEVYLLGVVDFEAALTLQRRLHFDICDRRTHAALLVCEHPPLVSVGRLGSHAHLRDDVDELRGARFPVRWVNRGGGCILHMPGQLAVYPVLPLDRLGLDVAGYLERLSKMCLALVSDFSLRCPPHADEAGVWVGDRLVAAIGVAVRDWVSSFGVYLNVQPPLEPYRRVQTLPAVHATMTSLERERRGPVRPAMVRQRLVEHFQTHFGFPHIALFSDHSALAASTARSRGRASQAPISRAS